MQKYLPLSEECIQEIWNRYHNAQFTKEDLLSVLKEREYFKTQTDNYNRYYNKIHGWRASS